MSETDLEMVGFVRFLHIHACMHLFQTQASAPHGEPGVTKPLIFIKERRACDYASGLSGARATPALLRRDKEKRQQLALTATRCMLCKSCKTPLVSGIDSLVAVRQYDGQI